MAAAGWRAEGGGTNNKDSRVSDDRRQQAVVDAGSRSGWSCRGHQQDRKALEATGQVHDETQRRRVGPVEIVDGQQDRSPFREVGGEPIEAVEHGKGVLVDTDQLRLGAESRTGQHGGAAKQFALHPEPAAEHPIEQLTDHAPAVALLELSSPGLEHRHVGSRRSSACKAEQARLANAGRTLDDQRPASARRSRFECGVDLVQLCLTIQEIGDRHLGHRNRLIVTICAAPLTRAPPNPLGAGSKTSRSSP